MSNSSGTVFVNTPTQKTPKYSPFIPPSKRVKKTNKKTKMSEKTNGELRELEEFVEDDNKILYEITSVFPFQLFPDKIIVHPTKIMVVHKQLFFKNIFPMLIRDINTVTVTRGLIFASIRFEIRSYEENPGIVNFIWPEHASKAESIILGLISATRDRGIDISKIPTHKARRVMRKIGESKEGIEKML